MFSNPAILVCVICGVVYSITALLMLRFPPKKINDFYGYRTSLSKKSQKHWDYAQVESAKYMKQVGYYSFLCCAPFILFSYNEWHVWIAITIVTLLPFLALIQTEKAIKKRFKD